MKNYGIRYNNLLKIVEVRVYVLKITNRGDLISWRAVPIRHRLRHNCESGSRMVQAVQPTVVVLNPYRTNVDNRVSS